MSRPTESTFAATRGCTKRQNVTVQATACLAATDGMAFLIASVLAYSRAQAQLAAMFRLADLVKNRLGPRENTVRVWDFGVRAFHWLLVASVIVAAWTGIVLGRTSLAWSYARFASFSYPPAAIVEHVCGVFVRRHRRHLGHNPLGALMVFAFFAVLAAIVMTGTVTLGGLLKQGPLKAFLCYATRQNTLGMHRVLAWLMLGMIVAHLLGVAFESWRGRENLVRAMVTGEKPREPADDTTRRPELGLG